MEEFAEAAWAESIFSDAFGGYAACGGGDRHYCPVCDAASDRFEMRNRLYQSVIGLLHGEPVKETAKS